MKQTLLLVDDNEANLQSYALAFKKSPFEVLTAGGGKEAIKTLESTPVDVVVTDLKMPEIDGMALLEHCMSFSPSPGVIIITAYGTVESAVNALRKGAVNYLTKPVNVEELRTQVEKALALQEIVKENIFLHEQIDKKYGFEGMIGETPEMLKLFEKVRQIARSNVTALIEGESGTGKELLSRAIHQQSARRKKPFVPVHCASLTETLLESELFGHERGAFTGAVSKKPGQFELADEGTLFLDEVSEIPLSVQIKLLRVLETKEFLRVGGVTPIRIDASIVAATNRSLEEEAEEGRFRNDLFYRLKVVSIKIPPLRDRTDDIPLFVRSFVREMSEKHGKRIKSVAKGAMDKLLAYPWPGNVRELKNSIENIVVFLEGDTIHERDLPESIRKTHKGMKRVSFSVGKTLESVECDYIRHTLIATQDNRTKAAQLLGISRRTLQRRLKELGMDQEEN